MTVIRSLVFNGLTISLGLQQKIPSKKFEDLLQRAQSNAKIHVRYFGDEEVCTLSRLFTLNEWMSSCSMLLLQHFI